MTSGAPAFEDLYDDDVLAALDRHERGRPPRAGGTAALALTAALMAGVAAVLEDAGAEPAIAELEPDRRAGRRDPVTVHLVPGAPASSVAVVRPWLL